MKFLTFPQKLALQLKLDHGNGLMHLAPQLLLQRMIIGNAFDSKHRTRVVFICFHGIGCQRKHVDPIAVLQNIQVSIADAVSYNCGNAGSLSHCRPHPHNIMISPLDIKRVVFHQPVHNKMRSRTSVKNISQNVKMIHNQTLDQLCQSNDKVFCSANLYDGIDNGIIVSLLVKYLRLLCDQFLYHIGIIRRKSLSHLGSGIFGCSCLTHLDQTIQGDLVPVFHILLCFFHQADFFSWIIDQGGKVSFVMIA